MEAEARHYDVGAYVLGVLDPGDVGAFEAHLATCDACADEVAALLPVVRLLPVADTEPLLAQAHRPRSLGPIRAPAAPYRRPSHAAVSEAGSQTLRRLAIAAGVVGVALAAGSFAAGSAWSGRDLDTVSSNTITTSPASPTSPVARTSLRATDAATGVSAELSVASLAWGSQIELTLAGVHGPLRCELVAVGADASSTVVASWSVGQPGYGVDGQPRPLRIEGASAQPLGATNHFEIRAHHPDGATTTLVSIPAT